MTDHSTEQLALFMNARDVRDYGTAEWDTLELAGREAYLTDAAAVIAAMKALGWAETHTPTDDEREAQGWREAELYASADGDARDDFMTGWRTADRLRRSEVPEPSADHMDALSRIDQAVAYIRASWLGMGESTPNTPAGEIIAILRGVRTFTPEPQGEPSDAQVKAAAEAIAREWRFVHSHEEMARAALRAASVTEVPVEDVARIGFDRMAEACRDDGRWADLPPTDPSRDYHLTLAGYHIAALRSAGGVR